jgi:quercetin dioxygenase-like cupin family protein
MLRMPFLVVALMLGAGLPGGQAPAPPPGFTVKPLLDNATVTAVKLKLAPGAAEQPHTHPYPMLVIVLTPSEIAMHNGEAHTKGVRKPGDIDYVEAGVSHNAANAGTMPLEALVLAIKPDRMRGGAAPPAQATPGVTRTSVLDRPDVAVTRLEFEADVREPVHTHPYDLLIVPVTPARLDLQVGDRKDVHGYGVGEAIFVPRNVPHAVANVGTSSFRLLGIAFK